MTTAGSRDCSTGLAGLQGHPQDVDLYVGLTCIFLKMAHEGPKYAAENFTADM